MLGNPPNTTQPPTTTMNSQFNQLLGTPQLHDQQLPMSMTSEINALPSNYAMPSFAPQQQNPANMDAIIKALRA